MRNALLALLFLTASPVLAADNFSPGNVSDLSEANVKAMIKTVAVGGNHRPFQSATPLGNAIGFDIGLDVSVINVPEDFKSAMALAVDKTSDEIPGMIPLPKLNIHKGLPGGFNLGFSYIAYQDLFRIYGLDVQWTMLRKPMAPNLAVRFTGCYTKLYFIQTRNFAIDVVASKRLAIIDPYIGTGIQYWNGNLSIPFPEGTPQGMREGIPSKASSVNPHIFFGLPIKLLFLKISGEIDYSFAGLTTYGGKLSLNF